MFSLLRNMEQPADIFLGMCQTEEVVSISQFSPSTTKYFR